MRHILRSQFNEVALDYNAGFTATLAWLCAHGRSAGQALPDNEFPPKAKRNESLDLLTTDREFFVAAKKLSNATDVTEIEATLWNRSRWPARVGTNLSFRYFFTLDAPGQPQDVQATVTGSEKAKAVLFTAKAVHFVQVSFSGDPIYPGNMQWVRRTVRLRITGPGWNEQNDWSHQGLGEQVSIVPHIAVYENGKLVGGQEPTAR